MNRTILVDAPYLLKRSFDGNKNAVDADGKHIGGLYSFFTTLRKIISEYKITKCILFWDGINSGYERYKIDRKYKSNRKNKSWFDTSVLSETEIAQHKRSRESMLMQKLRVQQYAEELFMRQVEVEKIEADDLISYYCIKHHKEEEILIYTNDSDYAQLLDLDIRIYFAGLSKDIGRKDFFMSFGYHYKNVLPIKIICGDNADCIKGIDGVGVKTLMRHFPDLQFHAYTVNDIVKMAKKINDVRITENKKPLKSLEGIYTNIDRLVMNHKLVNLKEPMLNDEALDEMEQLEMPLDVNERDVKNLYKLMLEDQFLYYYTGQWRDYIQPFMPIIINEQKILKEYHERTV